MKRALALIVSAGALTLGLAGTASAACVAPYCAAPGVVATGASSITDTSATLTGTVNPNNSGPTNFVISINGAAVGSGTIPDGTSTVGVVATASGLTPSTSYTYSITASNAGGSATASSNFTTLASAASGGGGTGGGGGDAGGGGTGGGGTADGGGAGATGPEAKAAATEVLDTAVKQITGFTGLSGVLTVYVAANGAPTGNIPQTIGSTVVISTTALDNGTTQDLLAVSCVALSCTTTVDLSANIPGGSRRAVASATIRLPTQKFTLSGGDAGVVKLKLTAALRKALKQGKTVTLTVRISSTDSDGVTKTATKTLKLRGKVAKVAKKKTKTATGQVAPAFTG